MSTTKISEIMKKYSKHLGKLYWYRYTAWDNLDGNYNVNYTLVMAISLERRYGRGAYKLKFECLEETRGRPTGVILDPVRAAKAADFESFVKNGVYVPVCDTQALRPEPYISNHWTGKDRLIATKKVDGEQNML